MRSVVFTRQFGAGNSQAVRIPSDMAFPLKTELRIQRHGDRIIIESKEETLENFPLILVE